MQRVHTTIKVGVLAVVIALFAALPATAQTEPLPGCSNAPGAPAEGAEVIDSQEDLDAAMADGDITDAVIDFDWEDDQINVDGIELEMLRVTMRGAGDGHTIKVTDDGRLEARAVHFDSDPLEDHVQGEGHSFILVQCSQSGNPGLGSGYGNPEDPENAIDIKNGGNVHILRNQFYAFSSQGEAVLANFGPKTFRIEDNDPVNGGGINIRDNITGTIAGNNFNGDVLLDEVNDMDIDGNDFRGHEVRYGAASSPSDNFFRNNLFGSQSAWDYRNGTCFRNNNDIRLDECSFMAQ